jgi:hypothetical protein
VQIDSGDRHQREHLRDIQAQFLKGELLFDQAGSLGSTSMSIAIS